VKNLKNRIPTFTGHFRRAGRGFNQTLGTHFFYWGGWIWAIYAMYYFLSTRINSFALEINDLNYKYSLNITELYLIGSILLWLLIVFINCRKILKSMASEDMVENSLPYLLSRLFFIRIQPEREGNNVPKFMQNMKRKDTNSVFFGIKKYGLRKRKYYFVSKPQDKDGHIIVVGGAGSGKSSCIAKPTLETWDAPVLAIDIKGELTAYWHEIQKNRSTAKKRALKVFDPTKTDTCGYDPFYLLRQDGDERLVQNAREIALSIIPLPHEIREPFWVQAAQNLLTGAILFFYNRGKSFSETMNDIQITPADKLCDLINDSDDLNAKKFVNQFVDLEKKVIASIATELSNKIMVFATDPLIQRALRDSEQDTNCFTWKDLEQDNIFLCLPEDKIEQWGSLITLMLNQLIRTLERRPDKTSEAGIGLSPILLLLDEIARMGKVESLIGGTATLRSKNVVFCMMIQSLAQLDNIYGKEARRIIVDNCPYKAILSATDAESQKYFSDLVGNSEVEKESRSIQYEAGSGVETGYSSSWNKHREAIIFPAEFAKLKDIVILSPEGFCRVDKEPYYEKNSLKTIRGLADMFEQLLDLLKEKIEERMKLKNLAVFIMFFCTAIIMWANIPRIHAQISGDSMIMHVSEIYEYITGEKLDESVINTHTALNHITYYINQRENTGYTKGRSAGEEYGYKSGFAQAEREAKENLVNEIAADRTDILNLVREDFGYIANITASMYDTDSLVRNYRNIFNSLSAQIEADVYLKAQEETKEIIFNDVLILAQNRNFISNDFNANVWDDILTGVYITGRNVGSTSINQQKNYIAGKFDFDRNLIQELTERGLVDLVWFASNKSMAEEATALIQRNGINGRISSPVIESDISNDADLIKQILEVE
jgi:type IV secretion system protein VirD4